MWLTTASSWRNAVRKHGPWFLQQGGVSLQFIIELFPCNLYAMGVSTWTGEKIPNSHPFKLPLEHCTHVVKVVVTKPPEGGHFCAHIYPTKNYYCNWDKSQKVPRRSPVMILEQPCTVHVVPSPYIAKPPRDPYHQSGSGGSIPVGPDLHLTPRRFPLEAHPTR